MIQGAHLPFDPGDQIEPRQHTAEYHVLLVQPSAVVHMQTRQKEKNKVNAHIQVQMLRAKYIGNARVYA